MIAQRIDKTANEKVHVDTSLNYQIFAGIINLVVSIGGLILLNPAKVYTDTQDEYATKEESEASKTTFKSLFILPVILLGMVTETLIAMIVNTIESFYPNYYSVKFGKHEGYVGTVLAFAGLTYCIGTVVAGK